MISRILLTIFRLGFELFFSASYLRFREYYSPSEGECLSFFYSASYLRFRQYSFHTTSTFHTRHRLFHFCSIASYPHHAHITVQSTTLSSFHIVHLLLPHFHYVSTSLPSRMQPRNTLLSGKRCYLWFHPGSFCWGGGFGGHIGSRILKSIGSNVSWF